MHGATLDALVPRTPETASRWYVVETKQHRESVAQTFLRRKGIPTYLPMVRQWPEGSGGPRISPLFPSYLFVRCTLPDEFAAVAWTAGVKGFVPVASEPIPLGFAVVDFLKSREDAAGVVRCADRVVPSSEVLVVAGPLRGLTGVVESRLPARERVRILIDLMHRRTPVEMPEHWLRPS